jgi:exonuclease SbcC
MKLRDLSLRLFRQHIATDIQFPDGLIGIVGTNGSGKTTLVEAVGFAIYGSRALRGRVEDVRTKNAPFGRKIRGKRDGELQVTLSLEHEGVIFRIERSLAEALLYVGGEAKPVAAGNRDVSTRIAGIVGMSYEEFIATYCTEQKGLEFLSGKKGATEREKFIVRMMGYDRLEEMQEALRADRKEKRAILSGYEASLGSRDELETRLEKEVVELAQVRERHQEAAKSLERTETDFAGMRERMVKLEDARQRYMKERESVRATEVRLEERSKRLRGLTDSEGLAREQLARAMSIFAAGETLSDLSDKAKTELSEADAQVSAKTQELRQVEFSWRDKVSRAAAERDGQQSQIQQLEKRAARLDSLDAESECPTCAQPLGTSFEQVRRHFDEEIAVLKATQEKFDEAYRFASEVPAEVAVLRDAITSTEKRSAAARALVAQLAACRQHEEKLSSFGAERRQIEGDISLAQESLERAQKKLSELRFSEDEYLREKGAHDASQRLLEISRLQRVRLEGEVNTKEAFVSRSKEEIVRFDERRLEVDKLRREVRILDECDKISTDFRKYVNASIRPRLAEIASEYLADLTDGRYAAVELAEDFTPTVMEDGEPKPVISGGEEDILNLCMRLSLSHMLAERAGQHFSLLMLDEVFGSLDEGRRSNVLALLEKLRKRFEQIIIITHLDDIKDGVQHLVQVDYDEGSGSAHVVGEDSSVAEEELLALNV